MSEAGLLFSRANRSFRVEPGCALAQDEDGTRSRRQTTFEVLTELAHVHPPAQRTLEILEPHRQRYKLRTGSFRSFLDLLIQYGFGSEVFNGLTRTEMQAACQRVVAREGDRSHIFTRELSRAAHAIKIPRVLVSGSYTELIELIAKREGVDIVCATQMEHVNGVYTGEILSLPVKDKGAALAGVAEEHGFSLEKSIYIGDSPGDFLAWKRVGYPVIINPKEPSVWRFACEIGALVVVEKGESISFFMVNERGNPERVRLSAGLPQPLAWLVEREIAQYLDYEVAAISPCSV